MSYSRNNPSISDCLVSEAYDDSLHPCRVWVNTTNHLHDLGEVGEGPQNLEVGQVVDFDVAKTERGLQARDVVVRSQKT